MGPWLLYANRTDPFQKRNLVGQAGQRDLQARLERRLAAMLKRVEDEFLPGARYVERAKAAHYLEVTAAIGETKSPWGGLGLDDALGVSYGTLAGLPGPRTGGGFRVGPRG